jgi:hypothetical protein
MMLFPEPRNKARKNFSEKRTNARHADPFTEKEEHPIGLRFQLIASTVRRGSDCQDARTVGSLCVEAKFMPLRTKPGSFNVTKNSRSPA